MLLGIIFGIVGTLVTEAVIGLVLFLWLGYRVKKNEDELPRWK